MTTKNTILTKVLTTPSKLARSLDWKISHGKILGLNIQKNQIELAIASHPSHHEPATKLDSLSTSKNYLNERVPQRLADLVQEHNICGFVVAWPVQKETAKLGYSCGLTIHTLEKLLNASNGRSIITSGRPVCLWDKDHTEPSNIDKMGRCADFSRPSSKTIHLTSKEQYNLESNQVATQMLNDFLLANWPKVHQQNRSMEDTRVEESWQDDDLNEGNDYHRKRMSLIL